MLDFENSDREALGKGILMPGYVMVVVITAVGILIMARALHKTEAKMQSLPYGTENAKY